MAKHFTLVDTLEASDLAVVAAYGQILTSEQLNTPRYGCLNVHPSLLPKYRGPSPIQKAILNSELTTGITIIKMDEEVDHGPIIFQVTLELSEADNFDILSKKMFARAAEILPKLIEKFIKGEIKPVEQNHEIATYCEKLSRESGYFDINSPPSADALHRMIRAYYPWPGVWTRWNNKIIKFLPDYMIQMEGKKAISLKDFLNGYPDFPIQNIYDL